MAVGCPMAPLSFNAGTRTSKNAFYPDGELNALLRLLYDIDDAGRAAVERSGAPDGYVWAFTSVANGAGEPVRCGILVKVNDLERRDPSPAYLEVLQAGWSSWGLDPGALLQDIALTV